MCVRPGSDIGKNISSLSPNLFPRLSSVSQLASVAFYIPVALFMCKTAVSNNRVND